MLKETTLNILYSLGFEPDWVDELGYIISYDGIKMICAPEEDKQTVSIVVPQAFEVTETNRTSVLEAMVTLCSEIKYVQTSMAFDAVWLNYEHYLGDDMPSEKLITHMIMMLAGAYKKYLSIIANSTDNETR